MLGVCQLSPLIVQSWAKLFVLWPSLRNQASIVASTNSWKGAIRLQKEVDAFKQTVYDEIVCCRYLVTLTPHIPILLIAV